MCGIYGSTKIYAGEIIRRKLNCMAFRGPDNSEYLKLDNKLILGHNRLAILDLDARSNQPFHYEHLTIVFNGEIYNFGDIRRDLKSAGYVFNTSSDTEVICAAYLAHGTKCTALFNGMFSFVIYDGRNQTLFGARDRVGKKPFYYSLKGGDFEFASQLGAIALGNSFEISNMAINKYLLRGYVEDPYSIYEGVFKLKAGHAFQFDLNKKEFREFSYWDIALPPRRSELIYEEAKSSLKDLLEDAVRIRLIADVPLGTFLSGGTDSSLITAIAASQAGEKINAFSVKFHDDGFDESEYAKSIADYLGVNHTIVPCNYEAGIGIINEINDYYDEPFADSSAVPSMLLARQTRKYMTVALSGDGGDEVFMGYSRYQWIKRVSQLFLLPVAIRKNIAAILRRSKNIRYQIISQRLKMNDVNALIQDALNTSYYNIFLANPYSKTEYEYVLDCPTSAIEQKIADLDFKLYLCNDGLVKVDRATMAASMEARCPLLDYRIVEFGRSLPIEYRYAKNNQKRILKDILYEYVPKVLLDRPKKGFTMPFREWFKSELKEYVYDLLTEENLKMIPNLNIPYIREGIEKHMKSEIDFYSIIWRLIILVNWLNAHYKKYR